MEAKDFDDNRYIRLSDRILFALEMALDQEDVTICDALVRALEDPRPRPAYRVTLPARAGCAA